MKELYVIPDLETVEVETSPICNQSFSETPGTWDSFGGDAFEKELEF